MKKHKIKTAVSGLGRIGWSYHLPELYKNPDFQLAAVVDPLPERLNETAEKWGVGNLYTSYGEMLAQVQPDLVVVASPTPFHTKQILEAFKHGADVLCEKPLTTSLQETDYIISEMKRMQRKLMVYQPRRIDLDCRQAKAIIESGMLGPVYMIKRLIQAYRRRNDWQALKRYGGGMLNNYGAHYIDQLIYVTGLSANCEYSELKNLVSSGDADDFVKLILKNSAGTMMDIEVNQASSFQENQWMIFGKYGAARWTESGDWQIKYYKPESLRSMPLQDSLAALNRKYPNEKIRWHECGFDLKLSPVQNFYENSYSYFAENREPLVKVSETRHVMQIIEQAQSLSCCLC